MPVRSLEVYSTRDVAEILEISERTVRRLCDAGMLPARRVGSRWRISRAALERWLAGEEEQAV